MIFNIVYYNFGSPDFFFHLLLLSDIIPIKLCFEWSIVEQEYTIDAIYLLYDPLLPPRIDRLR